MQSLDCDESTRAQRPKQRYLPPETTISLQVSGQSAVPRPSRPCSSWRADTDILSAPRPLHHSESVYESTGTRQAEPAGADFCLSYKTGAMKVPSSQPVSAGGNRWSLLTCRHLCSHFQLGGTRPTLKDDIQCKAGLASVPPIATQARGSPFPYLNTSSKTTFFQIILATANTSVSLLLLRSYTSWMLVTRQN